MKEIPLSVIKEIAELIDCGLVCYLNPDTFEIEDIPGDSFVNYHTDIEEEIFSRIDKWEKFIKIIPPESWETYNIMEEFTVTLPNTSIIKQKLINALNRKRPFSHFKEIIETSEYSSLWFEFKNKQLIEFVKDQLNC